MNQYEIEKQRQACWSKIDAAERALEPLRVQVQAWEKRIRMALDELDGLNAEHGPALTFEQMREVRRNEVLRLSAGGYTRAQIASKLGVAVQVVSCDLKLLDIKTGG